MTVFLFSCTPKNYPINRAYVYKSSVQLVKSKLPLEERNTLQLELNNYLDDSLKVQTKSIVGISRIIDPPVFDSANIERSKLYIQKNYLSSLGYYRPRFDTFTVGYKTITHNYKHGLLTKIFGRDTVAYIGKRHFFFYKLFNHIDYAHNEIRATINIVVETGIKTKVDTVAYAFKVPDLEKLALASKKNALVKKGDGYSIQATRKEMDRLVSLYNNNGYFKLSRGAIVAEGDTTDKSLVSLENDPLLQLQQASQRFLNPTVGLKFMQRPNYDSSYFLKYTLGNINIYPESFVNGDLNETNKIDTGYKKFGKNGVYIFAKDRLFRGKAIRRLNSLVPGKFYNAQDYFNTINAFTQVGAWQQADVKDSTYTDSIPKVDLDIFLYPAKKYSYKVDLEGSSDVNKNTANLLAGSYVGLSLVTSFLNKNFAKSAVQWSSNARGGFELSGSNIFQYLVGSVGTTFTIPRLWPPIKNLIGNVASGRTLISSNFTYTDRKDFFTLKNLNAALIFEWRKKKDSRYTWTWKLPNVELVKLSGGDSLANLIAANPYLGYAFNKGLVVSTAVTVQRHFSYPNQKNAFRHSSDARLTGEESGLLFGDKIFGTEVFKFWKLDAEFRHLISFPRHKWAFRFIGGFGRDYAHGDSTMPFFRQFIGGGPNSLRAWRLRQVGLGSSLQSDTTPSSFKDRLGDIYLEWNAEYRFNLFKLFSFPVEGALFTDVGNIWNRKPTYNATTHASNGGDLNIKSFYRDLAVASGVGFRIDLTYLRIRADVGYKVKDPVRDNDGWMRGFEWKSWDRVGVAKNSNVSVQIGIDYPF